jgi:hypothetical protein
MKCIPAIIASLLLGFSSTAANAQSTEQVLGAIAGGALGSTIGDGDGQKAATVIGAIIGWRMGERVLRSDEHRDFMRLDQNDFRRWCRREVPQRYEHRLNLRDKWVAGCTQRLQRQQRELEREAYMDGLNDGSSNHNR